MGESTASAGGNGRTTRRNGTLFDESGLPVLGINQHLPPGAGRQLFQQNRRESDRTAGTAGASGTGGQRESGQGTAFAPAPVSGGGSQAVAPETTQAKAPTQAAATVLGSQTSGRRRQRSVSALTLGLASTTKKRLLGQ